jgi:hypothetical protein
MSRDGSGSRVGRMPWRALAATVVWLTLAGYGQAGGAKPGSVAEAPWSRRDMLLASLTEAGLASTLRAYA